MVPRRCRVQLWPPTAMQALLHAVKHSPALSLLMGNTAMPNRAAWDDIAAKMAMCGGPRSTTQITARWKVEKVAFHRDSPLRGTQQP